MLKVIFIILNVIFLSNSGCANEKIIILVGPPGSGKGTLSQYLVNRYDYSHISAGDLLRTEVNKQTDLGKEIKQTFDNGLPVPYNIMQSLLAKTIDNYLNLGNPLIIDGFGGQYESDVDFLYNYLMDKNLTSKTFAIFLDSSDEICKYRMFGRLICVQCNVVYNETKLKEEMKNNCACGGELIQRSQDTEDKIRGRLSWYNSQMKKNYSKYMNYFSFIKINTDVEFDEYISEFTQLFDAINNSNNIIDLINDCTLFAPPLTSPI